MRSGECFIHTYARTHILTYTHTNLHIKQKPGSFVVLSSTIEFLQQCTFGNNQCLAAETGTLEGDLLYRGWLQHTPKKRMHIRFELVKAQCHPHLRRFKLKPCT